MLHNIRLVNTYLAKDTSQKDVWMYVHDDIMDAKANGQVCLFCAEGDDTPTRFFGGYVLCDLHFDKSEGLNRLMEAAIARRIPSGKTEGVQEQVQE